MLSGRTSDVERTVRSSVSDDGSSCSGNWRSIFAGRGPSVSVYVLISAGGHSWTMTCRRWAVYVF